MTTIDDLDTITARDGGCDQACDEHDSTITACALYGCAAHHHATVDLDELATMLDAAEQLARRLGLPRSLSHRFTEAAAVIPRIAEARR